LAVQGNRLKAAGADFFLLACNTVHAASDHIEKAVDLPFLHIVDPAARQVAAGGFQTVGLLGSRYTMTGSYFSRRLRQRYGLRVLVAGGAHQDNVHRALYEELAKGSFLPATRAKFQAAIADLVTRGAEVIILACTEFGMLVKPQDSPVPIIDTATAHAEAAVDIALASAWESTAVTIQRPHRRAPRGRTGPLEHRTRSSTWSAWPAGAAAVRDVHHDGKRAPQLLPRLLP